MNQKYLLAFLVNLLFTFSLLSQTDPSCGVPTIECPAAYIACPSAEIPSPDIAGHPVLTGSGATCASMRSFFVDVVEPIAGCPNGQDITRTWTAHYEGLPDQIVTCTQNIKLTDEEAPVIDGGPTDLAVGCDAVPTATLLTATDNCDANPSVAYLEWRDNGACDNSYQLTRKWTATDACGNESFHMQIITVADEEAPVINGVPENIAVSCDAVPDAPILMATDNCGAVAHLEYVEWRDNGACDNSYQLTRKWTATDECDNESIGMQIITVYDNTPPVLQAAPENAVVSCDNIPGAAILTATDNCSTNPTVTYLEWRDNGTCDEAYTITRKWTATDECGNESIQMQILTIQDNTAPSITNLPADITITCAGELPAAIDPTLTDNCSTDITIDVAETSVSGTCGDKTYTRTWTVSDACGNTSKASQTIVVEGVMPITIKNVPEDITLSCGDNIPTATLLNATSSCVLDAIVEFSETSTAGQTACSGSYTITRTWTATDYCDNTVSATQIITIKDEEAPIVTSVPVDITVSCDAIPNAPILSAKDNCDGNITPVYVEWRDNGTCENEYVITRKWTATDACGNEGIGMQIITVIDNVAPTISTPPANITVNCGETIPTAATLTATDNCDTNISITLEENNKNETCGSYTLVRTWTAVDACGNTATQTQEITVYGAPAITMNDVPADTWISCGQAMPHASKPVSATDACGNTYSVNLEETQTDGTCGTYIVTRTWTTNDGCGNTMTETQTISVIDEEAPSIAGVPADITVNCSALPAAPVLKAVDNCDATVAITFVEWTDKGNCGNNYILTRKWTAEDDCGNETIGMQVITVSDETAPAIDGVPADMVLSCGANLPQAPVLKAIDNCDGEVDIIFVEWRDNGTCEDSYTLTRKWTAVDACGNEAIGMQVIAIGDQAPPIMSNVPTDFTVNCGEAIPDAVYPSVVDDCAADISIQLDEIQTSESCGSYSITRTWTATDMCGNSTTDKQVITVLGSPGVTIDGVPQDLTMTCGEAIPSPNDAVTASDACGNTYTVNFKEEEGAEACGLKTINRTWSVAAGCSGTINKTQIITIVEPSSIVFSEVPTATAIGCSETLPIAASLTASDACGKTYNVTMTETTEDKGCGLNIVTRTWTALGNCGTPITTTQTVTVQKAVGLFLYNIPRDVTMECGEAVPAKPLVTANNLCGKTFEVNLEETQTGDECGNYVLTRIWTATDDCGDLVTASQKITLISAGEMTLNDVPADVTISCDASMPEEGNVTATNACGQTYSVPMQEVRTEGACGIYWITRNWSMADGCGGTASGSQVIEVAASTGPILSGVPSNISLACGASLPAPAAVIAKDACGLNYTVALTETKTNETANGYTLTRTWSATDACNNTATASQVITLQGGAVAISFQGVPSNSTLSCGQGIPAAAHVTASDNSNHSYAVSFNETKTDNACDGHIITRTWSATDACNSTASATQIIKVQASTGPILSGVPSNISLACGASLPAPAAVIAKDACGLNYTVGLTETKTNETANGYTLTRTWSATDACNNTATASQVITLQGGAAAISFQGVPSNSTLSCGQGIPAAAHVTASDNNNHSYAVSFNETKTDNACDGHTITRTWSATDACNTTASATQIIKVQASTGPVLSGVPSNISLACGASLPAPAAVIAKDACGLNYTVSLTETKTNETANAYVLTRTWRAVDACNNKTMASQVITLQGGAEDITFHGVPSNSTISCGQTPPTAANVTASDDNNYSYAVSFDERRTDGTCGSYTLTRTWTVDAGCNDTESITQIIKVTDSNGPVLSAVPANITIACGETIPSVPTITATDACGRNYNVVYTEANSAPLANGQYTLTRTWTATDACGKTASASQLITMDEGSQVSLLGVPASTTITCGQAVPAAAAVTAKDANGYAYIVSFDEQTTSGSACGSSTITRTWSAKDDCGAIVSASQVIQVEGAATITLYGVPESVTVNCAAIPSAAVVTAKDECGNTFNVILEESTIAGSCESNYQIKRTWRAVGNCATDASVFQLITVVDQIAPTLTCPQNIAVSIIANATATWVTPTVNDNCSAVNLVATHTSGSAFATGITTVTYTATDACGNMATCDFRVDVKTPQVASCQENIIVNCNGKDGAGDVVEWEVPAINLTCTTCPSVPQIAGFEYMGERGGHRYYCSKDKTTWHHANSIAAQMGGYLACIDDPAENTYLANFLTNQHAFIGLTDENSEGQFYWSNGEELQFDKWYTNQPNNTNNAQHYVQLLYNGDWNDEYAHTLGEFIVEVPCYEVNYAAAGALNGGGFPVGTTNVAYTISDNCGNIQTCTFDVTVETSLSLEVPDDMVVACTGSANGTVVEWQPPVASSCCNACPAEGEDIVGFVYMGTYNGHQYYCSKEPAMWQTANNICNNYGGYLATINSAEENEFLAAFLTTQSVFIGLNDVAQEGNFQWASGEPRTYNNWYINQPNNSNGNQDYCQMLSDGRWDDVFNNAQLEFVLEIPCVGVYQTGGPENGSVFPLGTTTVTYEAIDDCGTKTSSSFEVTVSDCLINPNTMNEYCHAQGRNTSYLWVDHIALGDIDNCSGNNYGYGDFTSHATNLFAGSEQSLYCYPGFANSSHYVNWAAWIDYNGDGDFDDHGEEVFVYRHYQALRVNFKVPNNCTSGQVKMRVAMKYGDYADVCEMFEHGEVEDYTVSLINTNISSESVAQSRSSNTFDVVVLEDEEVLEPTGSVLPTSIVDEETATTSITLPLEVKVYPNPVQHRLTIELADARLTNVIIFNQLGQVVHQEVLDQDSKSIQVNVQQYPVGMYYIQGTDELGEIVVKQFEKIE